MRMSVLCAVMLLVGATTPSAQLKLPPPGTSLDLTVAEREAIIKAYPGRRGTQMKSIDSPKLVYMNVWVDPEKRLQAGYVDPVLKKKPTQ